MEVMDGSGVPGGAGFVGPGLRVTGGRTLLIGVEVLPPVAPRAQFITACQGLV